ncbi:choline/ethanolaminephosphotransferase 1-like [Vicia villosa]|uniref:choline/ethanolaminephosphotransferase 1-like n=1 Tax=Vicia villosa TaxID=3911 RepID=UPI00273C8842|nr:choline/ethanolaminephosphotransferase 1-like [Vicia villosa]XP_058721962.1 choline/ethanolaminephosphotransferase 1-like [Vicia villosa]
MYIGPHGVTALHRHKYSGVDHSYVAKYVLQPFWCWFVNLFPLWMPPNLITLTGFMFLLISVLLGYVYSPQLDSAPPRWVHVAHGLLLFLYQTFDAVDGKQARRTNSSSPLGELFDHGCDALACALEALAFGSTAMCGRSTFWWWLISAITFFGATWEYYFINTLILPVVNGPTEGLMLIYLAHFFTAIVGAEWWAQQFGKSLPFLNWLPFIADVPTYSAALGLMVVFGVIPTVIFNVRNVHKVVKAKNRSMLLALAMLYPFVVLVGGVLIWDYLSPSDIIASYPHLVVMGTGLAFGYLVGRMILAHFCEEPKGLKTGMCLSLVYLPFAIANALASRLNGGVPLVNERLVVLGYCAFTGSLYMHFATSVIREITDALGIYCFRITRKEA